MKKIVYKTAIQNLRIGRLAMKNAQEENRKKGLPNVFSKNGKIYYELPDGTYTTDKPEILK